MLTAKWQITLLTIVVTHQIHSNSALFKNNAFEPIWWIQSCSNRSTAGKILWENGVVPPDGNVMVMFRPDILSLLKQHLLYKVKCCQIAKHIFDVLMFQHLSIQIWLTPACIWHILTISHKQLFDYVLNPPWPAFFWFIKKTMKTYLNRVAAWKWWQACTLWCWTSWRNLCHSLRRCLLNGRRKGTPKQTQQTK